MRATPDAAMIERSEILEMLAHLPLSGLRATCDEIVMMSIKRQQGVERVIHALLKAEIAAKQARTINYQLWVAKMPLAKELSFEGTPINGELIKQLASGAFLDDKRNIVRRKEERDLRSFEVSKSRKCVKKRTCTKGLQRQVGASAPICAVRATSGPLWQLPHDARKDTNRADKLCPAFDRIVYFLAVPFERGMAYRHRSGDMVDMQCYDFHGSSHHLSM